MSSNVVRQAFRTCLFSRRSLQYRDRITFKLYYVANLMSAARKQAPRLARPAARYWKGKAPKGVTDVSSDSDEEEAPDVEEDGDVLISGDQDIVEEANENVPVQKHAKAMNVSLKDVSISKDGKVTVAGRGESGRTAMEEDGKQLASSILFGA